MKLEEGKNISITSDWKPAEVKINKEYYRDKFKNVLNNFVPVKLNRFDKECLLDDLMECLDEEK